MKLLNLIRNDLKSINNRKKSMFLNFFFSNSFHVMGLYRVSHVIAKTKLRVFSRLINAIARIVYSCDIDPNAKLGNGVVLMHGFNIVIGADSIVGNNCKVFNGVTLGNRKGANGDGQPTVGDNCLIGTGAKLLGNIIIGNNVSIGANAVVIKGLPNNCTAVGIPAKIVDK